MDETTAVQAPRPAFIFYHGPPREQKHPLHNKIPPIRRLSSFKFDLNMESNLGTFERDLERSPSINTLVLEKSPNASEKTLVSVTCLPDSKQLPPKTKPKVVRNLWYILLTAYHRFFAIAFLANFVAMVVFVCQITKQGLTEAGSSAGIASVLNFLVVVLVRQEFFVNGLYRLAWATPWSLPLRVRRFVANSYAYGGVHSGAAIAGTMWFLIFSALTTAQFTKRQLKYAVPILIFTWTIQLLLLLILAFAYPRFREKKHNTYELMHRIGGWTTIELLWILVILVSLQTHWTTNIPLGKVLLREPLFWGLVVITLFLISPWLRLRRWTFRADKLSDHAMRLHFDKKVSKFAVINISKSPIFEWHPFATFPALDGGPGGSMVVSSAGDWTRDLIQNPQSKYWVKGFTKPGVLSMCVLFKRVVMVCTGSGIGPVLSNLIDAPKDQFRRVVWSTRTPDVTFGKGLKQYLHEVDPDAMVIDTRVDGRPNMAQLAYNMYVECEAEAVFIMSNAKVTRELVYALESRGVPAYGPVWDS